MDETSLPDDSVWEFVLDGTPTVITNQTWFDATRLEVSYSGAPPSTTGFLKLIATDPDLHSLVMAVAKHPQQVQFFP